MSEDILKWMSDMDLGAGNVNTEELIFEVEKKLNIKFPSDYKEFMLKYNGAEGSIGENSYLVIWPLEEIVSLNEEYEFAENTPELICFGSDGGGMAYTFNKNTSPISIFEIPFESIDMEDATKLSDSFNDFIKVIYEQD